MKITKEHVEQAIGYCLREKNDDFIIPLFESLTLDEVKDLFTYYDTDSNVSIGKLKTADELINKELLRLEKNELLEWNPHVYGEGWHLTELGGDVVKVLLEVYYNSYLKNEIDKNDFLKSCVTNIFQNHGSISLYLKSEFINGYIQINRETREVVSTEIPASATWSAEASLIPSPI